MHTRSFAFRKRSRRTARCWRRLVWTLLAAIWLSPGAAAAPQEEQDAQPPSAARPAAPHADSPAIGRDVAAGWDDWGRMLPGGERGWSGALQSVLLLLGAGLVPLLGLMATSYVRLAVVLGLLRQGFGAGSTPPPQVVTALALLLTVLVMAPVWREVHEAAVTPFAAEGSTMSLSEAVDRGSVPLKRFMSRQIIAAGNAQDVRLLFRYLPPEQRQSPPSTFADVPLQILLPAFLISELKVAFAIGFQIFLPFLVIDLIVSSLTTSLGMILLPPATLSLPLKLGLFVMVDGWQLITGMLLQSFSWGAV